MSQTVPTVSVVKLYTKFDDIFVRQAKGRYTNWRWFFCVADAVCFLWHALGILE